MEERHNAAQKLAESAVVSAAQRILVILGVPLLVMGVGWMVANSIDVKSSLAAINERFYWMQKADERQDSRLTKLEDKVDTLAKQ